MAKKAARITGTQAVLLLEGKHTLTGRWSDVEKCQGTDKFCNLIIGQKDAYGLTLANKLLWFLENLLRISIDKYF